MEQFINVIVQREQQLSNLDKSCPVAIENICYPELPNDEESPNTDAVRRRNRTPNPITWKRKRNALLRERGQSYFGIKTVVDGEGRKWCTEVPRGGRKMKPRCECKSPAFECKNVNDEMRQRLFDEFWALSWEEKRAYMSRLVVLGGVMRPRNRKDASFSRRSKSLKYFFETDGARYRVCKTMFLNTFDLSQWSVHGWPKKWASTDDQSAPADVDCLLDESVAATSSWFEEFIARLPNEEDSDCGPKKRKTSSPSTDSSKVDVIDEWISESEGENERVGSTTISFVDVSSVNCNLDENVDSIDDDTKYRECETSTPSVDLTSQQSDLHQMLLDMSRRMDEMKEKFDKRIQSMESRLSEISQNKHREASTSDPEVSVSLDRSTSSEEQEADSLTESQADAESVGDTSSLRSKMILPHITSHVQACYRPNCETCFQLGKISRNIEKSPSPDANSTCSSRYWGHPRLRRKMNLPGSKRASVLARPPSIMSRHMAMATENSARCGFCFRYYDDASQLNFHLNRHTINDEITSCCHCLHTANEPTT